MRRDRLTFAMMVGVPIMQLVLFGYAINGDPKRLPAAIVVADQSEFSRSFVAGLENIGYFRITHRTQSVAERPSVCWTRARCSSCWSCHPTSRGD